MAHCFGSLFRSMPLLVAMLVATPALAQEQFNPIGLWEPDNKESRYEFTYCGENGDRLCAELIWIQEDKKDARNTKYLNTYMFKNARHVRMNEWNGTVTLEGFNIGGTVTQTSNDAMRLQACALFVFCEDIQLNRIQ
ncbi:hypothetical protein [Pelagibacterium sp.]|uniref:hypothetical protein n=1 Tax=Pelagibacterium sp. TaxID=1967288 RepID=UPI003A930211